MVGYSGVFGDYLLTLVLFHVEFALLCLLLAVMISRPGLLNAVTNSTTLVMMVFGAYFVNISTLSLDLFGDRNVAGCSGMDPVPLSLPIRI
jgi:hypothetical protein